MLSMTGYGHGEAAAGSYTVTVELRSVNHRFLDVALRLPSVLSPLEMDIRNLLKAEIARGRISCSIQLDRDAEDAPLSVSERRIEQGLDLLETIANRFESRGFTRPRAGLEHLLAIPDLFRGERDDEDPDELRAATLEALRAAVAELQAMKRTEGAETARELSARLDAIGRALETVNGLVPGALEEAKTRLRERLDQLLDEAIDPQRLAQEAAILVDKGNINEECERLASHLDQFRATLEGGGQTAKRLNFLLQEMHREVNTMGSKTQDLRITDAVITMKDEIESMREQALNLE